MSSTLMSGHGKMRSHVTTLDELRALPKPEALSWLHKPVPHAALVEGILAEAERRGYAVTNTQLALAAGARAIFGVMDLAPQQDVLDMVPVGDRALSFGFRNSVNRSLKIEAVAGSRVTVCDNLMLSGDTFAMARKNTKGLDLGDAIADGFDKFTQHAQILEVQIGRLQETTVEDGAAKQMIYEVFAARIVPSRLFDDVDRFYFKPDEDMTDCQPRSLFGVHNAFTRAMKELTPVRQFNATVALGKFMGVRSVH